MKRAELWLALKRLRFVLADEVSRRPWLRSALRLLPLLGAILVLQLLFRFGLPYCGWHASPRFWTLENQLDIADRISVTGILAFGMTLTILIGGIDLSVGAVLALAGTVTAHLLQQWKHEPQGPSLLMVAIAAGMGVAGLVGAFNGLCAAKTKMPPFIITLATMLIARGAARRFNQGLSINIPEHLTWFQTLGRGRLMDTVPVSAIVLVLLFAATAVPLHYFRFGRYVYAIGGNAEAARLAGIPLVRIRLMVYTVCSLLAGAAGMVQASASNSGEPAAGQGFELDAIAAAVVGGTSITGGRGTMLGTLVGAVLIGILHKGLNQAGIHPAWQDIAKGVVILAAVYANVSRRKGA